MPSKVLRVDANTLKYQVPGGMLSNLIGQLKQVNAMDKYYDVLAEMPQRSQGLRLSAAGHADLPDRRHAGGDERAVRQRYKTFPNESKGLLRGEYGKLPGSGERGSPQDGHWRRQGDHLPPGRPAQAGNGQVSRGNPRVRPPARRTCSATPCSRRSRRSSLSIALRIRRRLIPRCSTRTTRPCRCNPSVYN